MTKLVVPAAMLWIAGCCFAQAPNTLSSKESSEGWMLLFDGKTLNGWDSRPTSEPDKHGDWKVENGTLACGGTMPSWLGSTASFSDFELKLEFKGPAKVNSGVFLRSQKDGQPHITGYELQIWDYQPQGYLTGSLVNSVKAQPTKILGDQWNRYDVTAKGDHIHVVLNGKTVLDDHNSLHASGVIGFQCQRDNAIQFRNVKVLPLKK